MQRIENHTSAHGVETKLEITPKEPLARFEFIAKLSQQTTSPDARVDTLAGNSQLPDGKPD